MKTNRRDFIKITSAGIGGLWLSSSLAGCFSNKDQRKFDETKVKRTPTYCEICFWKCAGWVYTNDEGEIWKIIGNDEDPHCNGRFCPRGTGGVGTYYDEDRLKTPLIRTTENGKQVFKQATWDEAFDFIVNKLNEIKTKHGAESLALFNHGTCAECMETLVKAFGSHNEGEPAYAQCRGPREVAFQTTFGSQILSPEPTDIRDTRCLVLIGSHIGENMHNGQVQEMSEAIDKGATIITVDPRFSTAASKSKYWLPIKPATDIALLLAWIHEIIYNDWYDKPYIEKYATGFDKLKEHVKNFTPEWAYGITTIEPKIIRETAREMANAKPAVIVHPGRHVTWYGDDTQRLRCIAILNALLGSWGRRGGFYIPTRAKKTKIKLPEFPKPKWSWEDLGKYPLAGMGVTNALIDLTLQDDKEEKKVRAWLVNSTNIINTLPDKRRTLEAIQKLELMVVIDTMPMEITGYADVILPECTYLERYDILRFSQHREPYVALRMPATKPKYDTKPGSEIAGTLARKLGLGDYFPWKSMEERLEWECQNVGTTLEEMKKIGVKKIEQGDYYPYFYENEDVKFDTNSGKIELYATALEEAGFDPLPKYTKHPEPPAGFYRLIYGRAPMHTFARTVNSPNLNDLMDENTIWINPKVATEWDLKNDQYIWLKNQDEVVSSFSIKVRITERIRWDSVYMVHGFGHTEKELTRAFAKGISDTEMITNVMIDPIMGGTGMRGNFVTFLTEKPQKEVKA